MIDWDGNYRAGVTYRQLDQAIVADILLALKERMGHPITSALDLGCGAGELAIQLSSRGLEVVGIDSSSVGIDRARIAAAQSGITPPPTFLIGDITALATLKSDRQFETIWNKLTIAFIKDQRGFFQQAADALKPGGAVITITPILNDGNRALVTPKLLNISVEDADLMATLSSVFPNTAVWRTLPMLDHGQLAIIISQAQ